VTVNRRYVVCLVLVLLLLAGCQKKTDDQASALIFSAMMEVNGAQEFHVRLGVQNASQNHFAGDDTFHGQMALRYADSDRAGNLVVSAEVSSLEAIAPGETDWLIALRVQLDPGAYTLTWGSEGYDETTVEFQIVERDGRLYLDYSASESYDPLPVYCRMKR
jgi:hypothetical protein